MPWNGSGTFVRNYSWVQDDANGIDITASRMDNDTNDIVNNGFGNCITRDGQGVPTANLPMAGFRHTGVSNGAARTDYSAIGQIQDGTVVSGGLSTGAAGVFAITLSPAITAYVSGAIYTLTTHQAAAGADTLNINAVGAKPFVKGNGTAVIANDFGTSQKLLVMYDAGGGGRFVLINIPLGAFIINEIDLGVAGSALGILKMSGNTSGTVTIETQAVAGTFSFILPNTTGVTGQPLVSGGGGPLTWGNVTGTGNFVLSGSPAFSGTPTAPTQSLVDNSQALATTAWVKSLSAATVNLAFMTAQPALVFNSPGF